MMLKNPASDLEIILEAAAAPEERIPVLNSLAWKLISTDAERAGRLAEEALGLSQKTGDSAGRAYSLLVMGTLQMEYDTTENALATLSETLTLMQNLKDSSGTARVLDSLGWCWYIRGDYSQALTSHERSLAMRQIQGNPEEIADSYNSLSAVYSDMGNYPEAVHTLLNALTLAEQSQNLQDQVRFLTNIGTTYVEVREYETAQGYLRQALDLSEQIDYKKSQLFIFASLALIYKENKEYEKAVEEAQRCLEMMPEVTPLYQKAETLIVLGESQIYLEMPLEAEKHLNQGLAISQQIGDNTTQAKALLGLGRLYHAQRDDERSTRELRKALNLAEEAEHPQLIYRIHETLSEAYANLGDYQASLQHHRNFHMAKEEVFNRDALARRRLLEIRFDIDHTRREHQAAETLRRVGTALNATLDSSQVLDLMVEHIRQVAFADMVHISLMEDGRLQIKRSWCEKREQGGQNFPINLEAPIYQTLLQSGKPITIADTHDYADLFKGHDDCSMQSWAGAPIIYNGKTIGLIAVISQTPNMFNVKHGEHLSIYASQAALALENAHLFEEVQRMAILDGLTGIYNRRYLFEMGQKEFDRAQRYKAVFSAVMMDIDHFKKVNDTQGHLRGDQVLREVAIFGGQGLRKADIFGRYGGEEFLILLPETNLANAVKTAERIRQGIIQQVSHKITLSAGVAELSEEMTRLEDLIDQADQALYRAKNSGRDRVSI